MTIKGSASILQEIRRNRSTIVSILKSEMGKQAEVFLKKNQKYQESNKTSEEAYHAYRRADKERTELRESLLKAEGLDACKVGQKMDEIHAAMMNASVFNDEKVFQAKYQEYDLLRKKAENINKGSRCQ